MLFPISQFFLSHHSVVDIDDLAVIFDAVLIETACCGGWIFWVYFVDDPLIIQVETGATFRAFGKMVFDVKPTNGGVANGAGEVIAIVHEIPIAVGHIACADD